MHSDVAPPMPDSKRLTLGRIMAAIACIALGFAFVPAGLSVVIAVTVLGIVVIEGLRFPFISQPLRDRGRAACASLLIYAISFLPYGYVAFLAGLDGLCECVRNPTDKTVGYWLLGLSWLANPAAWAGVVFLLILVALPTAVVYLAKRMASRHAWQA